jgi:hypothetical protein
LEACTMERNMWMVNVTSSCLPCSRLAVARRTSFGRPYEAENWLNKSDIVVGIVRKLRRWHWPLGNSQSTLFFRLPAPTLALPVDSRAHVDLFGYTVWTKYLA